MKKKTSFLIISIVLILILIGLVVGGYFLFGEPIGQAVTYNGAEVKYVVPVMASLKCDVIDQSTSTHQMPENGIWLSKDDLGINTKTLRNIKVTAKQGALGRRVVKLNICDANKQNCGGEQSITILSTGSIELNDLDLTKYSYYIYTEKEYILFLWNFLESEITYTYDKFGLNIYSTTTGFSKTVCTSSCDLTCPTQSVRNGIVSTSKNSLNFYETVDYLEYWNEPAQVGDQLGGTIWISSRQEFCFGGYIYKAGTLNMENGNKYIYPKTYDRKEDCCPGAVISTSSEDKICQDNFKWKTIVDDKIECNSDYQCPGQGQDTCQLVGSKYIKSSWGCSGGYCEEGTEKEVKCCPPSLGCLEDQICSPEQGYKCVLGSDTPPIDPRYCQLHPEDPICIEGDCGYWTIIPGFAGWDGWKIPDLFCIINNFINKLKIVFSIIVGFFGGLLGSSYASKLIPIKKERNKWIMFFAIVLFIGSAVGYLAYIYFWWILLVLIILSIIRIFIPGV